MGSDTALLVPPVCLNSQVVRESLKQSCELIAHASCGWEYQPLWPELGCCEARGSLCPGALSWLLSVARKPTRTKHSRGLICSHTVGRQAGQPVGHDRRIEAGIDRYIDEWDWWTSRGQGSEFLLRELWKPGVLQGNEGGFDHSEEFGKRGH